LPVGIAPYPDDLHHPAPDTSRSRHLRKPAGFPSLFVDPFLVPDDVVVVAVVENAGRQPCAYGEVTRTLSNSACVFPNAPTPTEPAG
jgi:hypothetical protein